jgi:integrase
MVLVAYKHGLRASEICNLRLDDLDMKNGSIVIHRLKGSLRTTQAVTEQGVVVVGAPPDEPFHGVRPAIVAAG